MTKKELSLEVIERGLKDDDWRVRAAAMNACTGRDIPLIRTIEPPEKVYKKCLGDVIVVAEIPKDAQVRGSFLGKCRANKAKIVDIIGDLWGEKVGVSCYDKRTLYFVGDEVDIDDFDISCEECSTGFHFFAVMKMLKNIPYERKKIMYKVYLTDHDETQAYYLSDFKTREWALLYILKSLEIGGAAHSIVFTASNNVVKVFNSRGLHYASYVIKEEI